MTENEALEMIKSMSIQPNCEMLKAYDFQSTVIKALEDLGQYRAIGTIDEFKALKEKNEPKKVDEEYCCPICHTCGMDDDGIAGAYCTDCGQKLDWSE